MCYLSVFSFTRNLLFTLKKKKQPNQLFPMSPAQSFLETLQWATNSPRRIQNVWRFVHAKLKYQCKIGDLCGVFSQSTHLQKRCIGRKYIPRYLCINKRLTGCWVRISRGAGRSQQRNILKNFVCSHFLNWGWNLTVVSLESCDHDTGSISWCTASG